VGHEALEYSLPLFEKFKKEVFRVPSKDVDCTVIVNADKEYLRNSDVETWLKDMDVESGNKFKTQMSKLKALKIFYDFIRNDSRMASWKVDGKLLLRKNPLAIFLLKGNGVNKNQYQEMSGILVPADTPCAVSHLDQANIIIYWIVNIRMQRPRKGIPSAKRLVVGACMRLRPSSSPSTARKMQS
jgi:hypothetical protein